jgi:cellulose synthase/poly-beta-1,6-N-acetylglucosamine synthase-like glycosyltransferase
VNYYLNRYAVREALITQKPHSDLGIVVVIPCCNEPNLVASLQSLYNCEKPLGSVEVIVVINASERAENNLLAQNQKTLLEAEAWSTEHADHFNFYFIEENQLPKKHAGVGLARKIGMDEAVRRFDLVNNHRGIIACFDADALCESNYLVELEKHFKQHSKSPACSIHFEHPIKGTEFPEAIYNGISQYELHLRYYKNGLAYANLPYAFHTIGSSMAVRSEAYQKQNGMNKRKAGEDFYFLQKLIPLGYFSELKTTKILPSPRVSDRVPFGTGKAMQSWLDDEKKELESYNPK